MERRKRQWRTVGLAVLLLAGSGLVAVQPPPGGGAAEAFQAAMQKLRAEREEAVRLGAAAELLQRIDAWTQQAEAAARQGRFERALRLVRQARWQLPYRPPQMPPQVRRLFGQVRLRHADRVNALAFSPDGRFLASAARDGTVKVWSLDNGHERVCYRGHLQQADDPTRRDPSGGTNVFRVSDLAYHPSGQTIASVCGNQVHLWDAGSGQLVRVVVQLKTDRPLKCVAFHPQGHLLAIGGDDGVVRVVETDTGKGVFTSPARSARMERVVWDASGGMIVAGDSNAQLAAWAVPGGRLLLGIQAVEQGEVLGLAVAAGQRGVVSGRNGKIHVLHLPGPSPQDNDRAGLRDGEDFIGHEGAVYAVTVSRDGKYLLSGGADRTVRYWDFASRRLLRTFQGHGKAVTAVAFSPDGRWGASGGDDGEILLWPLQETGEQRVCREASDSLWAVAYSPDGRRVATAGADGTVRIYDSETGELVASWPASKTPLTSLAFLPDGRRLAVAGGDRRITVWDIAQKQNVQTLEGHQSPILSIAVAASGTLLASGSADRTARGWNLQTGQLAWSWSGRAAVCAVAVRPGEERHVAVGLADGTLTVLDTSPSLPRVVFVQTDAHAAGIAALAFRADGQRLASVGGDGVIRLWSVDKDGRWQPLARFDPPSRSSPTPYPLSSVAFAPDGQHLAAAGADMLVHLWNVETRREVHTLAGHTDWVSAVAIRPDGRQLASVGVEKDSVLRLHDMPAVEADVASGHRAALLAIAVSPDGRRLATTSRDETVKVWDVADGRLLASLGLGSDQLYAVAFATPEVLLVGVGQPSTGTGRVEVWKLSAPPQRVQSLASGVPYLLVPSADGQRWACWHARRGPGDRLVHHFTVYSVDGRTLQSTPPLSPEPRAVAVAADLSEVFIADGQGTVSRVGLNQKEPSVSWKAAERSIADIGITPDKKYLLVADEQGTIYQYELATRKLVRQWTDKEGGVRMLWAVPDGRSLVTLGRDERLKVWSLELGSRAAERPVVVGPFPAAVHAVAFDPSMRFVAVGLADGLACTLEWPLRAGPPSEPPPGEPKK